MAGTYIPLIKRTKWVDLSNEHKRLRETVESDLKEGCNKGNIQPIMLQGAFGIGKSTTLYYLFHYGWEVLKTPTFYMPLAKIVDAVKKEAESLESGKVQNIVASSLRGIKAAYFDVIFTIHAAQAALEHYLYYPIAPNKMSALALTKAQARSHLGLDDADQVITVLIGADTKTVGIGSATSWGVMLSKIREDYPHAKILCSTSRRTPVVFEQELAQYAQQKGIFTADDQITWVAQGQQCDIKNYICAADWVLCSPDSTSMVAEVLMSNRPLLVFLNKSRIYDVDIFKQLKFLAEEKLIAFYDSLEQGNIHEMIQKLEPKQHSQIIDRELQKII